MTHNENFNNFNKIHPHRHPQYSKIITTRDGRKAIVSDWFDRLFKGTWLDTRYDTDLVVCEYAFRRQRHRLPVDHKVLVVNIDGKMALIHASEIQRSKAALARGWDNCDEDDAEADYA